MPIQTVPRAYLHGPGLPEDAGGRGVPGAAEEPPSEGAHERGQAAAEDGGRGRPPPQEEAQEGTIHYRRYLTPPSIPVSCVLLS